MDLDCQHCQIPRHHPRNELQYIAFNPGPVLEIPAGGPEECEWCMLKKLVFLLLSFTSIQSFASGALPTIKGYQEWKMEKIQISNSQMAVLKVQIARAQAEGNKKNLEALEKQLDQSKWNLEVIQDLSVTDYFVLYLSQLPQSEKFQQAASKMSTKEVALLMEAYANTLSLTPTEAVVQPSQQALRKVRLPVQAVQNRGQVK